MPKGTLSRKKLAAELNRLAATELTHESFRKGVQLLLPFLTAERRGASKIWTKFNLRILYWYVEELGLDGVGVSEACRLLANEPLYVDGPKASKSRLEAYYYAARAEVEKEVGYKPKQLRHLLIKERDQYVGFCNSSDEDQQAFLDLCGHIQLLENQIADMTHKLAEWERANGGPPARNEKKITSDKIPTSLR
jgi:hypothetical protein